MRIPKARSAGAVRQAVSKKNSAVSGELFSLGQPAKSAPAVAPARIGGPTNIGNVSTLLAVQGTNDEQQTSRAIHDARDTLDILDALKIDVLNGSVTRQKLNHLTSIVQKQRGNLGDPSLMNLLDQIELRARVELAKFEQYRS